MPSAVARKWERRVSREEKEELMWERRVEGIGVGSGVWGDGMLVEVLDNQEGEDVPGFRRRSGCCGRRRRS